MTIDDIKAKASELYDDDSCSCVIFTKGALWRVKSAWHDMSVMPDMNKLPILLEHKTGHIHFVDERLSVWNYLKKHYTHWAYIKDLIPEE